MITNLGKEFKRLREERHISISQLAKKANISKSTLSRFESGETQLAIDKFIEALAQLGLSLAEFENGKISRDKSEMNLLEDEDLLSDRYIGTLHDLQKKFKDKASIEIFSFFNELTVMNAQERLLQLLAKQMLSEISLHFDLPTEDQEFIKDYFVQLDYWSTFDQEIFLAFHFSDEIIDSIIDGNESVNYNLQFLSNLLIDQINKEHYDKAKIIANKIKDLTNK